MPHILLYVWALASAWLLMLPLWRRTKFAQPAWEINFTGSLIYAMATIIMVYAHESSRLRWFTWQPWIACGVTVVLLVYAFPMERVFRPSRLELQKMSDAKQTATPSLANAS